MHIYIYVYIYLYICNHENNEPFRLGYHHIGFMVTHALEHMMYSCKAQGTVVFKVCFR